MHLLLSPQPDDFARVQFAETVFEAIVIFDVAVSVLELVQCRLKHLQHHFIWDGLLLHANMQTHGKNVIQCGLDYLRRASFEHFI